MGLTSRDRRQKLEGIRMMLQGLQGVGGAMGQYGQIKAAQGEEDKLKNLYGKYLFNAGVLPKEEYGKPEFGEEPTRPYREEEMFPKMAFDPAKAPSSSALRDLMGMIPEDERGGRAGGRTPKTELEILAATYPKLLSAYSDLSSMRRRDVNEPIVQQYNALLEALTGQLPSFKSALKKGQPSGGSVGGF
jgi:hypothetical protein